MRKFKSQLSNHVGVSIAAAGGKVYVSAAGAIAKATLYDSAGAALANPLTPTNGRIEFYTADSVSSVDLYVLSPTGHFQIFKAVKSSGDSNLQMDTSQLKTTIVIPVSYADQAGDNTETDTGFALPGAVQPGVAVDVVTVDATETILFGTLSTASGDADGFATGLSIATAGYIGATLVNGAVTMGAKLFVQDSANAGDAVPQQNLTEIGHKVSYTLSAGADTFAGYIVLPVNLRPSAVL